MRQIEKFLVFTGAIFQFDASMCRFEFGAKLNFLNSYGIWGGDKWFFSIFMGVIWQINKNIGKILKEQNNVSGGLT